MPMTSDAKSALSSTIRSLREQLLSDLHESVEATYRLSLAAKDATLSEQNRVCRQRLEDWIDEQVRALPKKERKGAAERFRLEVEKDAAAALLQRLVFLRLLEANGLRKTPVVTGGWDSRGYKDFRELAPEIVRSDETEGYATLLKLVFDELAVDLPGLFGEIRLTGLVPIPAKTLQAVVKALDTPELDTCWTDDMTLGWIYQYWNDPEREALDAKLNARQKLENHEIASKTQMFTERYIVEWLLHNSLGPMWLAMCKKNGWTPEVEVEGTLAALEKRRREWRAKRDAGEVELTELMPLHNDAERRWAYYVPQPIPEDAVAHAKDSVRDLKILDPAVGSGHFLVVAFDLLAALYREEARHRGEEGEGQWSERAIVEAILEQNLHGIDIDPKAVQIAAAAVWHKAQLTCAEVRPGRLNLVASNLRLSSLPKDDPARRALSIELEREIGIPEGLTEQLIDALAGADHLGSLLKVDSAIDDALNRCEAELSRPSRAQGDLFSEEWKRQRQSIDIADAKASLVGRIEVFLAAHSHAFDLGLKLRGEQLASGVRFIRLVREGKYDLVLTNPPYQSTSKLSDASYLAKHYALGKSDLFAAFLLRGLDLVRKGGVSAMLTMRSWLFIQTFAGKTNKKGRYFPGLRDSLFGDYDLRAVGDLAIGAFEEVPNDLLSVAVTVIHRAAPRPEASVASQPTPPDDRSYDRQRTKRKRAAVLAQVGRYEFDVEALKEVPEWPLIYWWTQDQLADYESAKREGRLLGRFAPARKGIDTGDNARYVRFWWEIAPLTLLRHIGPEVPTSCRWAPYIMGGKGRRWLEPLITVVNWRLRGLSIRCRASYSSGSTIRNPTVFFRQGIAFTTVGDSFSARLHDTPGIIDAGGSSVYPESAASLLCILNSGQTQAILRAFNPTLNFKNGDLARLPVRDFSRADDVLEVLQSAFAVHESHREPSIHFESPGPSTWRSAQEWAESTTDLPDGQSLPEYRQEFEREVANDHASFGIGLALGRHKAARVSFERSNSEHVEALPAGILFLNGTLAADSDDDCLAHAACGQLRDIWQERCQETNHDWDLRTWIRTRFFTDVHRSMYENRPIYFPLSSKKKTFVAFVSIHRWDENTLRALLAEHLAPALACLEGELPDLHAARQSPDKKQAREAEKRYEAVTAWKDELEDLISKVEECAEKGPPPSDAKTPAREVDARYVPNLDDGVMINSAALWPLLEPQWKDPKKWWKQLAIANPKGNKDYDWSHLAGRYFPIRVDAKCKEDPSLAVAHGCFWKYHPEIAYEWELRLQDEIGSDFTIDEDGSEEYRAAFEADHSDTVRELVVKEQKRRDAKRKKQQSLDLGDSNDANDAVEDEDVDSEAASA